MTRILARPNYKIFRKTARPKLSKNGAQYGGNGPITTTTIYIYIVEIKICNASLNIIRVVRSMVFKTL